MALTALWLCVESDLTDPLARLRLIVPLDFPGRISRFSWGLVLLFSTLGAVGLYFANLTLPWWTLALFLPSLFYFFIERIQSARVNKICLRVDSHGPWEMLQVDATALPVSLLRCVKSVFGLKLFLMVCDDAHQGGYKAKCLRVMVWRSALTEDEFRYFCILTRWQMQQSKPS